MVVVDYHGHDETSTAHGVENPPWHPRRIFVLWYIHTVEDQGNAGGSANIDPVRGPMNEGGLYGERQGWHLPGFDTSRLPSTSTLMDGLTQSGNPVLRYHFPSKY